MKTIKTSVSFNPNLLEAVDRVVQKQQEKSRTALIERILRNDPDIYEELEEIVEKKED